MSMLHTIRGGYEQKQDITAASTITNVGLETGGADFTDKPDGAWWVGEEYNGMVVIVAGGVLDTSVAENDDYDLMFYGWADNGPAEKIADVSVTLGLTVYEDNTLHLWADTLALDATSEVHIADCVEYDGSTDRICRLVLDTAGYRWFYFDCTAIGAAGATDGAIRILARPY
jgi:hypothetical protein